MADAYQMFIDGEWVNSSDGQTRDVINPATGEVLATVQEGTKEDAERAVAAAKRAFEGDWFDSTPKDRQLALLKFADRIEEHADEIVKLEAQNVGKPAAVTLSEEIPPIVDNLRFFAGAARTMEGRAAGEYMAGFTSYVRREPIGVAGLIAPWNYPLMMAIWKIGPAMATGNTIVLKPSEMTPLTVLKLAELTADLLPPGVFNVVTGDGVPVGRHDRSAPRRRDRVAHRRHGDRQADRGELRGDPEAGPPGARRQGTVHRVRRRRHGAGRRMDQDRRLLQLRPGLHGLRRGSSWVLARTRMCWRSSCPRSSRSRSATRSRTIPRWVR